MFSSWYNIKLTNKTIENIFQAEMLQKGNKYTNYLSVINALFLVISIVASIIFSQKTSDSSTLKKFKGLFWILIILLFFLIVITVLKLIFNKSIRIKKASIVLNYFLFSTIFVTLRYIIYYSDMTNEFIHVVFYIDFLLKFIWLEISLIDFWENFSINFILIIASKFIQTFLFGWIEQAIIYVLVADVLRASSIFFAYFILRKKRSIAYYYHTLKQTNEWYKSVLDNINSGFVKLTNKKITFVNKCALDISAKQGSIDKLPQGSIKIMKMVNENQNKIITDIANATSFINNSKQQFININVQTEVSNISSNEENAVITNTVTHLNNTNSNNSSGNGNGKMQFFLDKIKNLLITSETNKNEEQFTYLGNTLLSYNTENGNSTNEQHSHFELYGRLYNNEEGENVEMIFNDVTRTKIEQEKNAEIRYKTTLLSKIAHEFKNPLICLTEIIEEENEKLSANTKNFKMITAITNYLLILIKDIDTFSEIQFGTSSLKQTNLSFTKIDLKELTSFIYMIAKYLIHKNHFDNKISFQIISKNLPQFITTDEIKLKQILINLISNSIKFTNQGSISLIIEKETNEEHINNTMKSNSDDSYIKFTVSDTGIGIPEEKQPELFKVFSKAKNNNGSINKYGAGLGLTITNEMSKTLGKQIQFHSVPNKGSSFWFSVKDITPVGEDEYFNDSSTTLKMSEIALNASPNLNIDNSEEMNGNNSISSIRPINILIADDEELIRNSMRRSLIEYANKKAISIMIIEASDGLEILYYVYNGAVKGTSRSTRSKEASSPKIDFIISDENMMFYTGKKTAKKLTKLENALSIKHIPFYLSSAFSFQCIKSSGVNVDGVFHKPLISSDLEVIFHNFNKGAVRTNTNDRNKLS